MKKNIKIAALLLTLIPAQSIFAQGDLRSAYFLEGHTWRHNMNPAFAGERNYISVPILGKFNIGLQSTLGVSDFIYKTQDGGLTTFLNQSVESDEFLGNLKKRNRTNLNIDMTILSFGFHAWGGFNTFSINAKTGIQFNLPRDMFEFMKNGMQQDKPVYQLKDMGIYSNNYAEIALGHQHKITDKLNIGAKMKFLVGLCNIDAHINRMDFELSESQWAVSGNGEVNFSGMVDIPTKTTVHENTVGGQTNVTETEELDFENIKFSSDNIMGGFGVAFDLGATYQIREDLQLSASLLDLGFIKWKSTAHGLMEGEWAFDGFEDIPFDSDNLKDGQTSIEDQIDNMTDDLEDCFRFKTEKQTSKARALGATLNLGALYTFPYYNKLKFGFLSSTRIQGAYSWSEGRFSANVAPVKCFEASINYAISSFGSSFGWVINLHPKGFNFYIGSNHQFFKITPQFVPVNNANANIELGINIPFGKRRESL